MRVLQSVLAPVSGAFIGVHCENYISIHIEWDMIVVTVFLSILNQLELHLAKNRKENCHHDHISFNVKGNGNIVLSVWNVSHDVWVVLLRGPEWPI